MAWIKIPKEHHPLFRAALPKDPRVTTINMFGGIAAMVNGHMAGGLFGRSAVVRLGAPELAAALALDGAVPFDPMGRGAVMRDMALLPDAVMDDQAELRSWLARAIAHTATMPAKPTRAAKRKPDTAKPAHAAKAARATKPAHAVKPARAAKPARTAKPAPAAKPARATTKSKRR